MSMSKRDNIMRKVQAMMAKAASTAFDAERDALLSKADEMMAVYAIEQFELDMARPANERERPEVRVFEFTMPPSYELRQSLYQLFWSLARHTGVMFGGSVQYIGDGQYGLKCVGYRSDLDWLQMLFINTQLHFLSRMEPKPDTELSDLENFIMLRESGMEYKRIFQLMGWPWLGKDGQEVVGHGDLAGESNQKLRKMRKAYHDHCKALGREPVKGLKADTYRASFMDGYVERIQGRLREMKQARNDLAIGHEMVLANRDDDLKEAFWDAFPDLRPHPSECECDSCHFMKCQDETCTRPRCVEYRKRANKVVRYREPKEDAAARRLGREVANSADLSGGRNTFNNNEQGEIQ
jgi:hypothetical protein